MMRLAVSHQDCVCVCMYVCVYLMYVCMYVCEESMLDVPSTRHDFVDLYRISQVSDQLGDLKVNGALVTTMK
jgi:hypothetical protein